MIEEWEQDLRNKLGEEIMVHANELREDEEWPISRDERDSYYDAASFIMTGKWSQ